MATKDDAKRVHLSLAECLQAIAGDYRVDRIEARRGKNIAKVAAARKLLTLVYYGLRDGHIRALDRDRAT
jgi:hypothetical protein